MDNGGFVAESVSDILVFYGHVGLQFLYFCFEILSVKAINVILLM